MPATLEAPATTLARRQTTIEGDFVVFNDVPVFKEHTRRQRDPEGKPLVLEFGSKEMRSIAYRCNRRIENTEDYAPIVIRHNHDSGDPEVVGFAGPFRTIQKIEDGKSVTYVVAKFRIYADKADVMRRYPRRSPELWMNPKKLGDSYFDPISLLGSETPELDLGICYSKTSTRDGVIRVCYQATMTAPSGANTFAPGMGDDNEERPASYEKSGGGTSLSHEDIAQILEAMHAVIEVMVQEQVAAIKGSEGDQDLAETVEADAAEDAMAGGEGEGIPGEGDALGNDNSEAAITADAAAETATAVAQSDDAENQTVVDDDDPDKPVKYAHQEDEMSTTTFSPADAAIIVKYKKDAEEFRVKYEKATKDNQRLAKANTELQQKIDAAEAEAKQVVRYSKLSELEAEGFNFDAKEESKEVATLSDEQFDKHVERIRTKYAKVPLSGNKYVKPPVDVSGDENNMEMRATYSKEARTRVERSRREGKEIDFNDALRDVYKENGKKC